MNRCDLHIDEALCWGCKTCEVACKQEHKAPAGVKLINVTDEGPANVNGKLIFQYRVNRCRHCDDPPCRDACAVEALVKRQDGLVILDGESCVGCGACVPACPFEAISFDDHLSKALKCNLCHFRLDRGLIPACADNVCPAHCISLKIDGDG